MIALRQFLSLVLVTNIVRNAVCTTVRPAIFEGGFPGYLYSNTTSTSSDNWTGMDVDIVRYLCNLTTPEGYPTWVVPGYEPFLNCTDLDQALITTSLEERLTAVISGDADFSIGGISWTPEREVLVDFIRPFYFATGTRLIGMGDTMWNWKDMKGKTLCAYPGYHALEALKQVYGVKGSVEVSGHTDAMEKIKNGECIGMLVDDDARSLKGSMKLIIEQRANIGATPYGIVVKKNAPAELVQSLTAAANSMLWSGRSAPMLNIAKNTFTPSDGTEPLVNVTEILEFPISAVDAFLTPNGASLDWSTAPEVNGSRSVPTTGIPINATVVVYRGGALPLSSLEGNVSFLEEGSLWEGIEIEILKVMCLSSIIQCTDVVVADTIDERIDLLSNGTADISVGSIVVNQDRLEEAYFVQPFYFSAGPALYVPKNSSETVPEGANLDYMSGKDVCTVTGSAYNAPAEQVGATLIEYATRDEAEAGIYNGDCIGLLWDSHVRFDALVDVASDKSMDSPIGIAIRPGFPVGVYSYTSALLSQLMSDGPNSKLVAWENEYRGSASPNELLLEVTDAITNFEPTNQITAGSKDAPPPAAAGETTPPLSSANSLFAASGLLCGFYLLLT